MDTNEELIDILTIQIALDDKIHKIQALQKRLQERIDDLVATTGVRNNGDVGRTEDKGN